MISKINEDLTEYHYGHDEPPQGGFTCSQANGFRSTLSGINSVIQRPKKILGCPCDTAPSFIWVQCFAHPVKQAILLCNSGDWVLRRHTHLRQTGRNRKYWMLGLADN